MKSFKCELLTSDLAVTHTSLLCSLSTFKEKTSNIFENNWWVKKCLILKAQLCLRYTFQVKYLPPPESKKSLRLRERRCLLNWCSADFTKRVQLCQENILLNLANSDKCQTCLCLQIGCTKNFAYPVVYFNRQYRGYQTVEKKKMFFESMLIFKLDSEDNRSAKRNCSDLLNSMGVFVLVCN